MKIILSIHFDRNILFKYMHEEMRVHTIPVFQRHIAYKYFNRETVSK